ncbi:MAG: hypothetical protein NC124_02680 [Clostridium sp.]|nr:hypothetical protein [Clostridium sp.]
MNSENMITENGQKVSVSQIEGEIKRMVDRCRGENQDSVGAVSKSRGYIIQNVMLQMRDMERTKAHYDELKDEIRYRGFFEKIKYEYDDSTKKLCQELLSDVEGNCNRMMESVGSMMRSVDGHLFGFGNEKFYHEYGLKKEGIKNSVLQDMEGEENGSTEIVEFGERTWQTVNMITKKLRKRKKLLLWLPVFLLIVIFLAYSIISYDGNIQKIEETAQEEAYGEESGISRIAGELWEEHKDEVVDLGKDMVMEAVQKGMLEKVISACGVFLGYLAISLGSVLVFLILLIIVLYATYVNVLGRWCKNQICSRSEIYISGELQQFEKGNSMMAGMENIIQKTVGEFERRYQEILNHIFMQED